MRLLRLDSKGDLSLTHDLHDDIPPYAILSHTWGKDQDEVLFDEVLKESGRSKTGYAKILFCGQQARKDGLEYFWVDTCCINKADLTELSAAINMMYRWYQEARKCYVYLSDVSSHKRDCEGNTQRAWESFFRSSRWFTRGWTLQELLAPSVVQFYSRDEQRLGDKATLGSLVEEITGISLDVLQGQSSISSLGVATRMRWAEKRKTTKVEDRVYCLLGIFGVSMSLRYGEGEQALTRLKNKIAKHYRSQLDEIGLSPSSPGAPSVDDDLRDSQTIPMNEITIQERRMELMTSLGFDQMESRRTTIKNAYSSTCAWFLNHQAYSDWKNPEKLEQHHGFLWISGKPGAGKSTLVKFLHASAARAKSPDDILLCFFFNARGDTLEKSTIGMYRALLYQLMSQVTDLQDILDEFHFTAGHQNPVWTLELLHELILDALNRLGDRRCMCFIDALDECEEQQVRDMVTFFEDLGDATVNESGLSICFASRHYPTIETEHGLQVVLEHESGHDEDLKKYVQRHLRIGKGKYAQEVRDLVLEKANGVFMWIVLVMDILNDVFRRGAIFAVHARLKEIPTELSDLFRDILRRDSSNLPHLLLCIQWILFAKNPLTREEFYYAMVAGLAPDSDEMTRWDPEQVTIDHMRRFVLNSSKGMAELTTTKKPTVQFIHESVRDFLIKDGGLSELWPEVNRDPESLSHDELKRCCLRYLTVDLSKHDIPENLSPKEFRSNLRGNFPFLRYAVEQVMYHADQAAKSVPQAQFFRSRDLSDWIRSSNKLAAYPIHCFNQNVSLPCLFAMHNCIRLLRTLDRDTLASNVECGQWRYPLFAALAGGHREIVRELLKVYTDDPTHDVVAGLEFGTDFRKTAWKKNTPLSWAIKSKHEALAEVLVSAADSNPDTDSGEGENVLCLAVAQGYEKVVHRLVTLHHHNTNLRDKSYKTPLRHAVDISHVGIARILLENGVSSQEEIYGSHDALIDASKQGQEAIIRLLLDHGLDVNCPDIHGQTAIVHAVRAGHEATVRLLLKYGSNSRASTQSIAVALDHAAFPGKESIMRLLLNRLAIVDAERSADSALVYAVLLRDEALVQVFLDHGACTESVRKYGKTSLLLAASMNQHAIARQLLEHKANVEVADDGGCTAMSYAAYFDNTTMLQQLLLHGANKEAKDNEGRTALVWAAEGTLQCLLDLGAHIETRDRKGRTPLISAAGYGHTAIVQHLLRYHAEVNAQDQAGQTPLLSAVCSGNLGIVELLLDYDAYIEARDGIGRTPLGSAAAYGFVEVVQLLLQRGACVESVDKSGRTALIWAASRRNDAVIQVLLKAGAEIEATDITGRTALSWAAQSGVAVETVHLLLSKGASIDAVDLGGRTALWWAQSSCNEMIIQTLECRAAESDHQRQRQIALNAK